MDNHTHGALIHGDGWSAFVDGIPDTCDHDWTGPSVIYTHGGKRYAWNTVPEWAGYTDSVRVDLIQFRLRSEGDSVSCMTGCCAKCGKEFQPEMW